MICPILSLYSSKMTSRSASLTFWKSTCLAVCAAILPKSLRSTGSSIVSPIALPGSIAWASLVDISSSGTVTVSTTVFTSKTVMLQVLGSIRRSTLGLCTNRFFAADSRAASRSLIRASRERPLSLPIWSITKQSSFDISIPLLILYFKAEFRDSPSKSFQTG